MKISEINSDTVKKFCNIDDDDITNFNIILESAKSYILDQTNMLKDELENSEGSLIYAVLVLCNDMYDTHSYYVDSDKVNIIVDNILFSHRHNFV